MTTSDTKLYTLLGEMRSDIKHVLLELSGQDRRMDNHSNRIKDLEQFKWRLAGALTVVSVGVGVLFNFI